MKNLFEKGSVDDAAMKSRDKKRSMFVKVITLLEIVGRLAAKSDCVANNAKYVKAVNKKIGSGGS